VTEVLIKQVQEKMKWYTQQFKGTVVERFRSQRLATDVHQEWRFDNCKCCQITVRNANKPMLLRYNISDRHESSSEKLQ